MPALLELVVAAKRMAARHVCTFELVDPDGAPLPSFTAGAHVDVILPAGLVRQYSLCNSPSERHRYLLAVLRTSDSRGGSRALHEQVREGDRLRVSRPRNLFPLIAPARQALLLAGGIGITPLLCMAEQLWADKIDFELHYCARSAEHAAFFEQLSWRPFAARVHMYFSEDKEARRIDFGALLCNPGPGCHVYACGPARFIEAIEHAASLQGWPAQQLHREHFGGTSRIVSSSGDDAFDLVLARSGVRLHVPVGVTALRVLQDAGIPVPSSCEQGVCGTCLTPIVGGEPDHRDLYLSPAEQASNDQFLPCCSRARSPLLVLDL